MAEESKEYKVKCPFCHKAVTKRGLNAHIRMAHPKDATDQPEASKVEVVPCPTDTESTAEPPLEQPSSEQDPPQPPREQFDVEQMRQIFGELMRQRDEQFLAQLPGLIDARIQSMVEQAAAQAQGRMATTPNPGPPVEQQNPAAVVEGQPPASGGGKLGELMGLMQMAQQLGLVPNLQQPQQSPVEAVTKMLGGLGDLFSNMDKVRGGLGGSSGTMSPNSALAWLKYGHQLGKSGEPEPEFPAQTIHPPPSPEMGKQEGG